MTDGNVREGRWVLLAETRDYSWPGRATDPGEDEISAAQASFCRAGVGGFLAVSERDY